MPKYSLAERISYLKNRQKTKVGKNGKKLSDYRLGVEGEKLRNLKRKKDYVDKKNNKAIKNAWNK